MTVAALGSVQFGERARRLAPLQLSPWHNSYHLLRGSPFPLYYVHGLTMTGTCLDPS